MPVLSLRETVPAPRRKGWKTTGWQGITLDAPPEWSLVAYGGDSKAGNLRLDNGSLSAPAAVGLEARWSQGKAKLTDADLEKRLKPFFAGIVKTGKKQKLVTETKSKPLIDSHHPERTVSRSFTWRSDRKGMGRIWHCASCGRTVIAQVVGGAREEFSGIALDVLASLSCHAPEDGWQTWSLYDLLTQAPAEFTLQGKPQLMNIYVQLGFARGNSTDMLSVEQWGIANMQLKGAYLDEWFRKKNAGLEPTLRYDADEADVHGHPALALIGRRTGLSYWATQALPQMTKLQRPATHFAARIWECPASNKIHLVQLFSRRPELQLLERIVERTQCHC